MLVFCDTSTLSALAKLEKLAILRSLYLEIHIPQAIYAEGTAPRAPSALRLFLRGEPDWIKLLPDPDSLLPEVAHLDPGEASAITLAWRRRDDSLLVIDEASGRAVARALSLPHTGLLGILIQAARGQLIDFEETVTQLRQTNFRISDALIEEARQILRKD